MGSSLLEADLRRTDAYLLATIEELRRGLKAVKLELQDFKKSSIKNETKRRKEPVENSSIINNNANPYFALQILNEPRKKEVLEESELFL
ncbi:hypothetical protein Zmor_016367 [Zophobas morio]|jgi:hypothetical protein|uniref:Uncharacterized protein n=1 Tax=Zophobas morio TaxID=2755281 RepID=A0AA38HE60_9CUCU|nr:hypothetical protein Zmor_016367 [Zophobas morio]